MQNVFCLECGLEPLFLYQTVCPKPKDVVYCPISCVQHLFAGFLLHNKEKLTFSKWKSWELQLNWFLLNFSKWGFFFFFSFFFSLSKKLWFCFVFYEMDWNKQENYLLAVNNSSIVLTYFNWFLHTIRAALHRCAAWTAPAALCLSRLLLLFQEV